MARPVWLVPYYTSDINKACTSFKVIAYEREGYDHRFKIPTNLGPTRHPCLISVCDKTIQRKVSYVQLVLAETAGYIDKIRKQCLAAGATEDFFGYVYTYRLVLMWK